MQNFRLDKGKIAILLAGLFCLYAVYGAISDFRLPSAAQAVEPAQPIIELDPVNIQLLSQTHLFGQPPHALAAQAKKVNTQRNNQNRAANQQKKKNQQVETSNTKPIKINVTVTGLLASNDQDLSAAMLKVDNKPEKLYRIGEDLGKPEVTLQSVELESIIIDNNGNEQTIAMTRPGLESNPGAAAPVSDTRANYNQDPNLIPELPPELELPEELNSLNTPTYDGAYTPPMPEPVVIEEQPLPEDLEEDMLQRQIEDELDEDIRAALEQASGELDPNNVEGELDDHDMEEIPSSATEDESNPDFQMPVF